MTALEQIARYIHETHDSLVGQTEMTAAQRLLVDAVGCAIAGARSRVATTVYEASQSRGRLPDASVIGFPDKAAIEDAVLNNSASIRALDFNDTYAGRNNLHPSEIVIPLVLAFAERGKWSGAEVLRAIARGYDLDIRLAEAIGPLLPNGWAPNATIGQIAGAGLAAQLMGLGQDQIAHAMAINVIHNATLGAVFKDGLSMAKSLASGFVVQNGVQAARLACHGVTGPLRVIEGKAGFVEMVAKDFDGDALTQPHEPPAITRIWLKAYPTMFHFHPSIEAAVQLRSEAGFDARDIIEVDVQVTEGVARTAASPEHWQVTSHEDAQFSLPYSVATSLAYGRCNPEQFTDEALKDEIVREVLSKLRVTPDASLDAGGHPQPSRVTIQLAGGTTVEKWVRFPKGHPENPLSNPDLQAKFRLLAGPVVGEERTERLLGLLEQLESTQDIEPVFAHLRRTPG
ncbi:MAG TPA: MmgE/PrpD family protein [Trueperaceae bacterium]